MTKEIRSPKLEMDRQLVLRVSFAIRISCFGITRSLPALGVDVGDAGFAA
jgi:hypothetical protein